MPNGARLDRQSVVVVGAGIIGVCCAYALRRSGFEVLLVEKDEPGQAASFGNSGSIGLASTPPLGLPGMLKDVPRMLMDPRHALVLRWRYLPRSLPWLLKFARTLDPARVEAISAARANLLSHAGGAYEDLLSEIGHSELIYLSGLIFAYEFRRKLPGRSLRHRTAPSNGRGSSGDVWKHIEGDRAGPIRTCCARLLPTGSPHDNQSPRADALDSSRLSRAGRQVGARDCTTVRARTRRGVRCRDGPRSSPLRPGRRRGRCMVPRPRETIRRQDSARRRAGLSHRG